MEATIVREIVENGRRIKEMSDGKILIEPAERPKDSMFCSAVKIVGEVTEEKLAKAKEMVIEEMCEQIRELAKTDNFFIIKGCLDHIACEEYTSVGRSYIIPNFVVNPDFNHDLREMPIVD